MNSARYFYAHVGKTGSSGGIYFLQEVIKALPIRYIYHCRSIKKRYGNPGDLSI